MNKFKTSIAIILIAVMCIIPTFSSEAFNYMYYTRHYIDLHVPSLQQNTFYVEKDWGCEWFEWDDYETTFCSMDWNQKAKFGSDVKCGTYKVISSTKKETCKNGNTYRYSTKIKYKNRIYTIGATGKKPNGKCVKVKSNRIFVSLEMAKLIYKFSNQQNGLQIVLRRTPINRQKIDKIYEVDKWE